MLGNRSDPSQQAFADLLRGLFHWKLDTTEKRAYSLDPADYPGLPLFALNKDQACYLNQVFWLVYDDSTSWRSLSSFRRSTAGDVETLAESEFAEIAESSSGPALPACPKISKTFVAYLEALVAVAPYHRGTADPRAIGYAEDVAADAFDKLNAVKKSDYMAFLKRRLGEWYRGAPKGLGPAPARREPVDEPAPSEGAPDAEVDGVSRSEFTFALD
jgi:hypothetical protein